MITTKLPNTFTETKKRNNLTQNRLLAALSPKDFRDLLPDMEQVSLRLAQVLYNRGDIIRYVYFPLDSLVSLLSAVDNRSTLEVGVVGNEGMTGIGIFLGVKESRFQAVVQGAGDALRMKTSDLRKHSENNYRLKSLLQLYTNALLSQVSQSAACNRFHLVEARLARWLLATRDRLDNDKFQQTQEYSIQYAWRAPRDGQQSRRKPAKARSYHLRSRSFNDSRRCGTRSGFVLLLRRNQSGIR